jgi:tRNA-dihydrouridine synthase B
MPKSSSPESRLASGQPAFWLRDIPIRGRTVLAPMDGYSDWPFRSLCRALGSAVSYTEFVSADRLLRRPAHMRTKLYFEPAERPLVFQIYGDDVDQVVRAALAVQELGPDAIDLNMGCPARSIAGRGGGVGLMRAPLKVARLVRRLTTALSVPLTVKMRLGWENAPNFRLISRIVEDNGAALIAIHARTKEQGYRGVADWDAIGEVKAAVRIPVIGNGDVKTVADVGRMRGHTGCDAVMIGRAAIANPWIFAGLDRHQVPDPQVREFLARHLERNIRFYGPEDGPRLFRKHAVQYLLLRRLSREDRKQILRPEPPLDFAQTLDRLLLPA